MIYNYTDRRTVAVLATNLETAIALNVLGHLAISIGAHAETGMMGRAKLLDASGVSHLGISRYPIIVKKAGSPQIRHVIMEARRMPDLLVADCPQQMLITSHDDELAAALEAVPEESLEYLGVVLYGPKPSVDALCRKLPLWR